MVLFTCSVNIARPSTGWLGRLQSHECDSLGIQEQFAHDVPEALVDLISLESWQESVDHFNREVGRAIRAAKRAWWFLPSRSPDDVALKIAVHLQRFLRANSYHTRFSRKASRPLAWLCSYVSANSTDAHYCTSAGVVLTVSDHNYGNIESLFLDEQAVMRDDLAVEQAVQSRKLRARTPRSPLARRSSRERLAGLSASLGDVFSLRGSPALGPSPLSRSSGGDSPQSASRRPRRRSTGDMPDLYELGGSNSPSSPKRRRSSSKTDFSSVIQLHFDVQPVPLSGPILGQADSAHSRMLLT